MAVGERTNKCIYIYIYILYISLKKFVAILAQAILAEAILAEAILAQVSLAQAILAQAILAQVPYEK